MFLSAALVGPYLLAGQYAVLAYDRGDPGLLATACAWLAAWGFVPYFVVLGLLLLLFPDGHLASPRWRWVVLACLAALALATVGRMFAETPVDASRGAVRNPLGLAHWPNSLLLVGSWASFALGVPLGLVSLLQRLRRSTGTERAQLQWLVLGGVALLVCFGGSFFLPDAVADVVFGLTLLCVPLSVLVAIVRHGLFDVELVLSRAIVLALLTGAVLASYAAVVALVGVLTPDRRSAYVAVAVVALLAASGRDALQAGVDRLLYGERRDPYAVVDRIGRRLERATGPADAVEALVHELRSVLRLPYAGVLPEDARLRPVEDGAAAHDVEVLPLSASGRAVGVLRVGHRSRGEEFTAPERAALTDVARRLGALLEAGSLTHEVQLSRERLVTRARRSAAGCAATFTTASARRWRRWPCGWSRPGPDRHRSGPPPRRSPGSPTWPATRSPRYDAWSTACARPRSTSSAWSPRCASRPARCVRRRAGQVVATEPSSRSPRRSRWRRTGSRSRR